MRNIKRILAIVPIISLLCMSFVGTTAKAEDKINNANTISNSNQSQAGTAENKTAATASNVAAANTTNTSGTNASEKSPSNAADKSNQNSSVSQNAGTQIPENLPAWNNVGGKLYYFTKEGIAKETGWFKEKDVNPNANNDNEYYLDKDYSATIGWKQIKNSWYYFNEAGIKQTGWKLINYEWYHLNNDGKMDKGWITDNQKKYYLNDEGYMVLGKKYIDNKWYFFGSDGSLQTGFYNNKGKIYYSDNDGVMAANEWINTKSSKYYVKADSSLATGYAIIDNEACNFGTNGNYLGPAGMKDHLYIKFLNVGDADCHFIKLPSGETVLIDTGTPESAEKVVDFLKEQNLKQDGGKGVIDDIVITHGHSDHIGGLATILDNFKVNKVYMPDNAKMQDWYLRARNTDDAASVNMMKIDYDVYKEAEKAMDKEGIKFTNTKNGDFIDKDKILQFVESDKTFQEIATNRVSDYYWDINDNCAIVYLNYGSLQSLFTGDMEWSSEKDFVNSDLLHGKKINLLKVPHHGNDTSSTTDFLTYLQPLVGIVPRSVGGDDSKTSFNNLLLNGVSLYKTGTKDGISIYATPENWTLQE